MGTKKIARPVRGRYGKLLNDIGRTVEHAKNNAVVAVNNELVKANWNIGRHIVEFEQKGNEKAIYGSDLLNKLSHDLKIRFGNGFSRTNIYVFRQFYLCYPIIQTVSGLLSWSHYVLLLSISEQRARTYYESQIEIENWSVRE